MTPTTRRLFFALWPDEATRTGIEQATAAHVFAAGGRPAARDNLHVTVAFLGSVIEERLACVLAAAGTVRGTAFDLVLRRVEHWPRPRILALQPLEVPPALADLVSGVWRALAACAFAPEARPFRAHLTLAREARAPRGVALSRDLDPIVWRVREIALLESITAARGARYELLQTWPLAHENIGDATPLNAL